MIFTTIHLHAGVLLMCLISGIWTAPQEDEVTDLPGLNTSLPWKHFSGYLKVSDSKQLHYWFVQSSSPTPEKDPLVLWLNGGPGCSSMVGLLLEHGPFKLEKDGRTLKLNPYAWNKVANMLYLEAPAGVGYSFPYLDQYDDDVVTKDNYEALKAFFVKFPELRHNSFFIAGESYGGFYVPTLSDLVVQNAEIHFKGFAVGNGLLDFQWRLTATMYFFYDHGIIGEQEWNSLLESCCGNQDVSRCKLDSSPNCVLKVSKADQVIWRDRINYYNIYDKCEAYQPIGEEDEIHPTGVDKFFQDEVAYPCVNTTYLDAYMNQKNVRTALHIPEDLPEWATCNIQLFGKYNFKYKNVTSKFINVMQAKKRILVYNGDMDALVSYIGNQWFLDDLGVKEIEPYASWSITDHKGKLQNAGYHRKYKNIDFVTIKGAGHKSPMDKPAEALKMFQSFIKNTPLSSV